MRLDSTKFHLDGGVNMAIYHFTTRIIKSSIGKCVVASAAYISGQKLKDARLGLSFNYTRKEEVVFAEVLLPKNAPEDLADRETLWNAVEKRENKRNSQYAREFEIAVPNEWNREQTISRMREFIKENFVNKGMAADWAYHEKEGNHHVHCMCTMRAFNKDGSWSNMRKTEFVRDDNGNKIPLLDENGKQKVRIRKGKGEEKLWKRIDVIQNQWNSKEQLKEWRKNWADYCNKFLIEEQKIDHRSFEEQGLDIEPTIHEGYAARQMEQKGKVSDRCEYNRKVKESNKLVMQIKKSIAEITKILKERVEQIYERVGRVKGSIGSDRKGRGYIEPNGRTESGKQSVESTGRFINDTEQKINRTEQNIKTTESAIAEIKRRMRKESSKIDDRIRKIKNERAGRLSRRTDSGVTADGNNNINTESKDTETIIRQLKTATDIAESIMQIQNQAEKIKSLNEKIESLSESDLQLRKAEEMMKEAMKIKEQTDRQREDNNAIINEIKVQKKLLENKEIKLSEKEKKLELRKQDLQKEVSQQVLMEKLKTENQMEKKYKGLIFILLTYGIVFSLCVAYRNSVLKKDIFQIGNWIKNIFIRVIRLIKKAYNIVGLEINCNIGNKNMADGVKILAYVGITIMLLLIVMLIMVLVIKIVKLIRNKVLDRNAAIVVLTELLAIIIFGDVINNLWKINLVMGAMVVLVIYAIIKVMVNVEDIVRRNYVLILISGGIGVALVVFYVSKRIH